MQDNSEGFMVLFDLEYDIQYCRPCYKEEKDLPYGEITERLKERTINGATYAYKNVKWKKVKAPPVWYVEARLQDKKTLGSSWISNED